MKPHRDRTQKPATPAGRPRHRGANEEVYHGLRGCEAIFARRPGDIVRVYVAEDRRRHFSKLIAWCAKERRGFQVVGNDSLERLTKSIHHEGIAILAKSIRRWNLAELLQETESRRTIGPMVYLDGVQNPHNLGSILRTAAHFGSAAVLGKTGELPPLSPAAVRVAEGAAEFVPVCDLADPPSDLKRLRKAGWRIVVSSSGRGKSVFDAAFGERCILVLGSEGEGVSREIDTLADERVRIPGTGAVESLNVSVACGILLGEVLRRSLAT